MQSAKRYTFLLVLLVFGLKLTYGQYMVKKTSGSATNTSLDGFYYAIPQTVLKIDLILEEVKKIPGPLADYAEDYLGVRDYINVESHSIKLINATITPFYEADPDQFYYVQFPAERSKDEKAAGFQLTDRGTLLGFGHVGNINQDKQQTSIDQTFIMLEGDEDFSYYADYNRKKKIDTIIRKISIDTVTINRFLYKTSWVDKSDREKANEAAQKIMEIREARYHLISGYQEVNYGESIKYMNSELIELERKYLELFLGKEVKTTDIQSIYYTPEKDKKTDILYNSPDGRPIEIKIDILDATSQLPERPLEKVDNIYYRVPRSVLIKVTQDYQTYESTQIAISQFGVVTTAPLNRTQLIFDEQTGNLINIIRE